MGPQPFSVIIPVYNEGENILKTLRSFYANVKVPTYIYLVYDFEEDTTVKTMLDHYKEFPCVQLIRNKYGRGVLNAIKTGFEQVPGNILLVSMADGSDEYQTVKTMYEKMMQGYDIVCASRYMRGGKQLGGPLLKRIMSRVAGVSAHYLSGIPTHDLSNNFRMYNRRIFKDIKIESTGGFELAAEITIKAYLKGYKICEVPTVWTDRAAGKSNFKMWKWLPKYLRWYFYLLKHRYVG